MVAMEVDGLDISKNWVLCLKDDSYCRSTEWQQNALLYFLSLCLFLHELQSHDNKIDLLLMLQPWRHTWRGSSSETALFCAATSDNEPSCIIFVPQDLPCRVILKNEEIAQMVKCFIARSSEDCKHLGPYGGLQRAACLSPNTTYKQVSEGRL